VRPVRRRRALAALSAVLVVTGEVVLTALAGAAPGTDVPPPTPVAPNASLSPFVTSLRTPSDTTRPPVVSSRVAILADLDSGQVLLAKDPDRKVPIASLTKIMTALLVFRTTSPEDVVTVSRRAAEPDGEAGVSELGLRAGERITVGDLTWALLVQSANDAAIALAEEVSGTVERFVKRMNITAMRLGMTHTRFRSPNGLDDRGFSSASDLVDLTRAAFRENPRFGAMVATKFHDVPSPRGRTRHLQNRNVLLWLYPGATGVKTGYTAAAGFCVVATAERDGRRLIAVVLGGPGEPFSEAASLLNYGFAGFTMRRFVRQGQDEGIVGIRGGGVPAAAARSLDALVPVTALGHVRRTVVVDPAAAFPPGVGERIGVVRVTVPGRVVGSVPLVVTDVPAPTPIQGGPWWERAAGSLTDAVSGLVRGLLG
jgi:D-alanyl-D-alanine carboxypeptidase (penicillin-binding protein 5/6)